MKQMLKSLLIITLFSGTIAYGLENSGNTIDGCCKPCCATDQCCYNCGSCCLDPCDGYPFLLNRSQGRNSARELVGSQQFVNQYCKEDNYNTLTLTFEYSRTMREERITQFLFGSDLVNCGDLLIQGGDPGGKPDTKHPRAWHANYFGLPGEYSSKVHFCPRIQNAIIDLSYYMGLDDWSEGLYVKFNAPLVWTKWQLCMNETIIDKGENDTTSPGYFSETALTRDQLPASFEEVMRGGTTFGDMQTPMKYGIMNNCKHTKTRIAEIDFSVGYNWHLEQDYHSGGFLYVAAPTGNRPCAKYMFEPVAGNGHHWEIGAGLSGSYIIKRDCDCQDRYIGIWMEATVSHLFKDWQCRSFDFCGKPNSRYMLLAQMGENTDEIRVGQTGPSSTVASYQYKKSLIPAINWSTFEVGIQIPVQADISIKLGWVRENWTLDVGYNFWARSGEKFTLDQCTCNNGGKFAFKGDAYMYGQASDPTPIPFSQSMANIQGGTNWIAPTTPTLARTNNTIDNKQLAWASDGITPLNSLSQASQMYASEPPIIVSRADLNLRQSPSSMTHKIFGHISYAWKDTECEDDYIPFIGIGGQAEFASDNYKECCCNSCCDCDSCCDSDCDSCCTSENSCQPVIAPTLFSTGGDTSCCNNKCCGCKKRGGFSQWGIWLKLGVSFE